MASKKTQKGVHETMVENRPRILIFHPGPLRRRNKWILKNKIIVTITMIMKMKRSNQPEFFSLQNKGFTLNE